MSLTAFVFGSGFAGKGHVAALRDCGVEVVGMASRTQAVVDRVADELGVPYATTDWEAGLAATTPDIVAIGTPGGAHVEPITAALNHGCHVFCDKPLAPTAREARTLYDHACRAGVKTAYAASYRYMPHVLQARELVAAGSIGRPYEVEAVSHFGLDPLIPFGWSHQLSEGGGRLNNNFPHKLAVTLNVIGGEVTAVSGTTRSDLERAPVVTGVHDFRTRRQFAPTSADQPGLEWAESDADWSYTVMARLAVPNLETEVTALFRHGGLQPRFHPDYMTFFGSEGSIHIDGHYGQGPLYVRSGKGEWQAVPLPDHIVEGQPVIDDDTQRNWTLLAKAFVADIRGEPTEDYPSFRDGWVYQEIIDIIRADRGWTDVSHLKRR